MSEFGTYGVKVVIFVNPNCLALQAFDSREGSTQFDCSISMSLRPLKKVFVTQAFFSNFNSYDVAGLRTKIFTP